MLSSEKLRWKEKTGASNSSMTRIGLIYDRIRFEEKEMIKAAKKINVNLKPIDSKDLCLNLSKSEGEYRELFGDIALQRCISYFRGLHMTAILESKGVPVVNSYKVMATYGPGDSKLSHAFNESIAVEEYLKSIDVLEMTVNELFQRWKKV